MFAFAPIFHLKTLAYFIGRGAKFSFERRAQGTLATPLDVNVLFHSKCYEILGALKLKKHLVNMKIVLQR